MKQINTPSLCDGVGSGRCLWLWWLSPSNHVVRRRTGSGRGNTRRRFSGTILLRCLVGMSSAWHRCWAVRGVFWQRLAIANVQSTLRFCMQLFEFYLENEPATIVVVTLVPSCHNRRSRRFNNIGYHILSSFRHDESPPQYRHRLAMRGLLAK